MSVPPVWAVVGLLVMSVPQDLALVLSGMTIAVLGLVAVGLARVKVIHGSPPLSHETLHGRRLERTMPS